MLALATCLGSFALSLPCLADPSRAWARPGLVQPAVRTEAYGGVALQRQRPSGVARLLLPYPTHAEHQQVGSGPNLQIIGARGESLIGAITSRAVVPHPAPGAAKQLLRLDLDLAALTDSAHLGWSVPVQIAAHAADLSRPIPLPTQHTLPAATAAWAKASPMIQSEALPIVEVARRIRGRASDLQSLVRETLREMASHRRPPSEWADEDFQNDALSFLETGKGDCVANANLFAALMRKNGVPTRVVGVIQRGTRIVQNMHYQNEYFAPGHGWIHVEPQGWDVQTPRTEAVHTGVVAPEMEAHGDGFMHYRGVIRHTMIGQEVDASGELVTAPSLLVSPGLRLASGLGDNGVGIHGAP